MSLDAARKQFGDRFNVRLVASSALGRAAIEIFRDLVLEVPLKQRTLAECVAIKHTVATALLERLGATVTDDELNEWERSGQFDRAPHTMAWVRKNIVEDYHHTVLVFLATATPMIASLQRSRAKPRGFTRPAAARVDVDF